MIIICFVGILIGSFALALVTAIMNGFEKATHEKIQGVHAQLIMRAHNQTLDNDAISKVLSDEFPAIASFSPTSLGQAIIQSEGSDDVSNIIMLKAIDPEKESDTTNFSTTLVAAIHNQATLKTLIKNNDIVLGKAMADQLSIAVGDMITILYTPDQESRSRRITLLEKQARVVGFFATGIEEFDSALALCSFDFFDTLFPDHGVTQFNLKLANTASEEDTIKQLQQRFHLSVISWKELYPALVAALKLEKYAMFIILALITLVASMNMISLLFMQIIKKRGDIAILKAFGASDPSITHIFVIMGFLLSISATTIGLLAAMIVSWLITRFSLISLPDAYYVTHLPAVLDWHIVMLIFIVVIGISMITTWIPARGTRTIAITQVLRFDS